MPAFAGRTLRGTDPHVAIWVADDPGLKGGLFAFGTT
jgi:hypothetical protein